MTRSKEADLARLFHLHTRHDEARAVETALELDRQPLYTPPEAEEGQDRTRYSCGARP